MSRWICDRDARGLFAVCEDGAGVVFEGSLAECEKRVAKLRARDEARVLAQRQAAGHRLAAARARAREGGG